jgi:hypothetical protein
MASQLDRALNLQPRLFVRPAARRFVSQVEATAANAVGTKISADGFFPVVEVVAMDVWVVKPLTSDWVVAYRIALQDGHPVVAEMRIYPASVQSVENTADWQFDGHAFAGEWAESLRGVHARVPDGGLTATVAHLATLGSDVARGYGAVLDRIERERPKFRKALRARGFEETEAPPRSQSPRGGPTSVPKRRIVEVAAAYAEACRRGSGRPTKEAARAVGLSYTDARNAVTDARHKLGFLTKTTRGQAGGVLTSAGQAAVAALQRIATDSKTGGHKAPQVRRSATKNARQSPRGKKRA